MYDNFDTSHIYDLQKQIDLLSEFGGCANSSKMDNAIQRLETKKSKIQTHFSENEGVYISFASYVNRDQAKVAQKLRRTHDEKINTLVLDIDDTLRLPEEGNNQIPPETLNLIKEFWREGLNIIISTGQTLEYAKGLFTQGMGDEFVNSGDVSFVYEAGAGVFTPHHGDKTKLQVYEGVEEKLRRIFNQMRLRPLPDELQSFCHIQGNEFNYTLKPNFETGTKRAKDAIDWALVYLLDLLEQSIRYVEYDQAGQRGWARAYYANTDGRIRSVLKEQDQLSDSVGVEIPDSWTRLFDQITVDYYKGDAIEVRLSELNKAAGVKKALEVLEVSDPSIFMMGDSKTDLKVMEWVTANGIGIVAAPDHASSAVLDHVRASDGLVFDHTDGAHALRTVYGFNKITELDE